MSQSFHAKWASRLLLIGDDLNSRVTRHDFISGLLADYGVTRDSVTKMHRRAQDAEARARHFEERVLDAERRARNVEDAQPRIWEFKQENAALRDRCKAADKEIALLRARLAALTPVVDE